MPPSSPAAPLLSHPGQPPPPSPWAPPQVHGKRSSGGGSGVNPGQKRSSGVPQPHQTTAGLSPGTTTSPGASPTGAGTPSPPGAEVRVRGCWCLTTRPSSNLAQPRPTSSNPAPNPAQQRRKLTRESSSFGSSIIPEGEERPPGGGRGEEVEAGGGGERKKPTTKGVSFGA